MAYQVVLTVKNSRVNAEDLKRLWVQSLSWEDPLKKGTPTHSSIPAWRIPQTEEPGEVQSMGSQGVGCD